MAPTGEALIPDTIEISVNFRKKNFKISVLEDSVTRLREHSSLKESIQDIGFRKEALIIGTMDGGAEGKIIFHDSGIVRCQFEDLNTKRVEQLVRGVVEVVCQIFGWELNSEPLNFDTEIAYSVPAPVDPIDYLRRLVEGERFSSFAREISKDSCEVGVILSLVPVEDKKTDLKVRIEPLARDPRKKFFALITHINRDVRGPQLKDHFDELRSTSERVFQVLAKASL
jgi:hypothetical protein